MVEVFGVDVCDVLVFFGYFVDLDVDGFFFCVDGFV